MATTAVLNLGLNSAQFNRNLAIAGGNLSKFALGGAAAVGLVVAGITGGLGLIGWSLIKTAADAEETENKFDSVFAGINRKADETAKNLAKNFGLSGREAQKLLGDTGDLLSGFGFATESALNFSKQVQELASDLTSFQNFQGGVEGASQAITAALTGETEKMKALGVVIRQGTTEYKNNVKALMQNKNLTELQAKATENLRIITEQSKNSIGDYAKTSKMFANQLKLTSKIWDDLKISVGGFLKEFTNSEGLLLGFNNNFRQLTTNVQGFLGNWQENFKILTNWIGDNFATLFLSDIPRIFETSLRNMTDNMAAFGKVFFDVWDIIWTDIGEEMSTGLLKEFANLSIEIIKASSKMSILIVKTMFNEFGAGKAISLVKEMFGDVSKNEKDALTLSEKIAKATADGLGKVKFKSLLEGFELKSGALEFNLKPSPEAEKIVKDLGGAASNALSDIDKSQTHQKARFAGAAEVGSVEAFSLKYQNESTKNEKEIVRWTRKTAENVASNNIIVNEVTI